MAACNTFIADFDCRVSSVLAICLKNSPEYSDIFSWWETWNCSPNYWSWMQTQKLSTNMKTYALVMCRLLFQLDYWNWPGGASIDSAVRGSQYHSLLTSQHVRVYFSWRVARITGLLHAAFLNFFSFFSVLREDCPLSKAPIRPPYILSAFDFYYVGPITPTANKPEEKLRICQRNWKREKGRKRK